VTLLVGRREPVLEVIWEKKALDEERPGVSPDEARVAAEWVVQLGGRDGISRPGHSGLA